MNQRLLLGRSRGLFRATTTTTTTTTTSRIPSQNKALMTVHVRPMSTKPTTKYYDSFGDYKADADALEDPNLLLYSLQHKITRLPVPSLQDTCERFLPTALPLAKTTEEITSLQDAVAKFPQQARALQERLLQRQKDNPDSSWLQHWWNTLGYLQIRDPVVVHVSYFFRCNDDLKLNALMEESSQNNNNNSTSDVPYQPCIARSAALLPVAIQYAQTLRTNTADPGTIGKGRDPITLCSSQIKYMFHACRIPQRDQDRYRLYFPEPAQATVAIACRGQFFSVPISVGAVGATYSQRQWRSILQHIIDQTDRDTTAVSIPSMGWLTGIDRNDWADARQVLLEQGGKSMAAALESLESSLFLLCMDVDEEIRTDRDRARQYWLGRSDETSSEYHNRWFDKSAAVMVTQNGKLGFQGEHSMLDGMPYVEFCDTIVSQGIVEDDCLEQSVIENLEDSSLPQVTNIFQNAFDSLTMPARTEIDVCLAKAKGDLTNLVNDYEMDVQHYQQYGSTTMKKAGCSPDAYIQLAMQLASYRMFREPLATYESTQVRRFLHGRTETTRTLSPASLVFCQAMDQENADSENYNQPVQLRSRRYQLLQDACLSHVKYIRNALVGEGVDRHFFGLSMSIEGGEPKPDLLTHPLFDKSKQFRLSTSSLPNMAVGFGPVVGNGLGVGYEAKPTSCIFHVTARKEHGWTSQYRDYLGEALDDMGMLYDLDDPPTSRL